MANHERLVENVKAAITELFSDDSVSRQQTREDLEDIAGDIDSYLDALDSDDANDANDSGE